MNLSFPSAVSAESSLSVPGDKSISHRALILGALTEGQTTITGLSQGDDVVRTRAAVAAMGATVTEHGEDLYVAGGPDVLTAPSDVIDVGNSGTGMRLLLGLAAGLAGTTTFTGDDSLRTRPMDRVAVPLRQMGADVKGVGERCLPPVAIRGGALTGISYTPPMASAQVKSAVLLAGLWAHGETTVTEPVATRAHTEEMLAHAGADIEIVAHGGGRTIRLRPSRLEPRAWSVPGDPSQAAFWAVAGAIWGRSTLAIEHVHLGEERVGFLEVLRRMGADLEIESTGDHGTIISRSAELAGTEVFAEEIPSLDEVPILAIAAACATGRTRFHDVGELRVKESDRLKGTAALVHAFGAQAEIEGDDLLVLGRGGTLRAGVVDAHGDHRMAMAAAIAAGACDTGLSTIAGWECVATSYPGFAEEWARLAGQTPSEVRGNG